MRVGALDRWYFQSATIPQSDAFAARQAYEPTPLRAGPALNGAQAQCN